MIKPVYPAEEPIVLATLVDAKTLNQSVTKKSHSMYPEDDHEIGDEVPHFNIETPGPVFSSAQYPNQASFNPKVSEIKKPLSVNRPAGLRDNPAPSGNPQLNLPEHNFDLSMDNENPVLMSTMDENSTQVTPDASIDANMLLY